MTHESFYAADGVNIQTGDDFSKIAAKTLRATWTFNKYVQIVDWAEHNFRGPRGFKLVGLPEGCFFDLAPDGAGTKTVISTEALTHCQVPRDLVAMTCGDITRWGGLPLMVTNVLDVATLGKEQSETNKNFIEVIRGLYDVAADQRIVMFKGETAELGVCVGSENPDAVTKFNWAGVAFGVYHQSKMITGATLEPGQCIVAVRERGFRSNGLSSVRKALRNRFGEKWWLKNTDLDYQLAIAQAAAPSILYDRLFAEVNGWYEPDFDPIIKVHSIAHITGGGILSKFSDDILFPFGLSAELNDLWDPPQIMRDCAEWRSIGEERTMSDEEFYSTWNGGQGALVVIDEHDVSRFVRYASDFGVDAKCCGVILPRSDTPRLTIHSKYTGKIFDYP